MATFATVNDFAENITKNMNTLTGAWTLDYATTDPTSGTDVTADGNGIFGNMPSVATTNYSDDLAVDRILTTATLTKAQTAGTMTFDYGADVVITASGGAFASFQYIGLYDDVPTTPINPMLGYWDHGSAIVLASTETATIAFNASGIYTLV